MNRKDLQDAIDNRTLVAWKPRDGRGLARVYVMETGISALAGPVARRSERTDSRIHLVQATFDFNGQTPETIVNNRELHEWTDDTEHTFAILNDREAFRSDTLEAAALAGITVAGIELISQRVVLDATEFQRICQILTPEQDVEEDLIVEDEQDDDQPQPLEEQPVIGEGKICPQCGGMLLRTGTCHTCPQCGYNDGCG